MKAPLEYTGYCCCSHERSQRKLTREQIHFRHSVLCVHIRVGLLSSGCAPEQGSIIKMSLSSGTLHLQMASSVPHPSPVPLTPVGQKIRLISFGTGCFPLRRHMLHDIAFYSLFYIKTFLCPDSYVLCWKSMMAALC